MIGNELKVYDGLTSRQQLNLFRNLYYNDGNATEYGIIANAINDCFTADVVPKSEVEALQREIARLEKALRNSLPSYCQVMAEKQMMEIGKAYGRREVAREIFEEIESISSDFPFYGNINTVILSERDLAFIKKKYTEELLNERPIC